VETCSSSSSININSYFKKILKSQFLAEFQSFVFGQFWAKIAALIVAESLPKVWLKSLKPITPKP
jgi:uncharacterized membrane protein YdcZ (DUF606 family)